MFVKLENLLFVHGKPVHTFKIKRDIIKHESLLRYIPVFFTKKFSFIHNRRIFREFFRGVDFRFIKPKHNYKELFEKYNPDLVFCSHILTDYDVIKTAKKMGVTTIGMTMSWDNFTSKGEVRIKPDKLIVWNEIMKKEAVELHDFSPKDIFISGVPQFDMYFKRDGLLTREEFYRNIGADPSKKLITYGTGSKRTTPHDPEIIEIVYDFIKQNKTVKPCQLLIRTHPGVTIEDSEYKKFKGLENVILEEPGRAMEKSKFPDGWNPNIGDMYHLSNLMAHSDIVINTSSTLSIDACCFDTPVINIAFDGYHKEPYWKSAKRYHDYTHYKPIVDSGGVRVAENEKELLEHINTYLKNPETDGEGRKKIIQEQCYYVDGSSGERLADYILKYLKVIK